MWTQTACAALRSGHVLQLRYDGYTRDVEVHAVGFTKDDLHKPIIGIANTKSNVRRLRMRLKPPNDKSSATGPNDNTVRRAKPTPDRKSPGRFAAAHG